MLPWNKSKVLTQAIQDWHGRKLIDQSTYDELTSDIAYASSKHSFNTILILLAAVCIGFAAVSFVASNWETMPRLGKTILLLGSMCAFWGVAIWCQFKTLPIFTHAAILVACSLFGASIMLIAQMYHIQGDAEDAIWLWALGTVIAAGLTRSIPALCLSTLLFILWFMFEIEAIWRSQEVFYSYLPYAIVGIVLALWMRSKLAIHLSLIGLAFWVLFFSATELFENITSAFGAVAIALCFFVIAVSFVLESTVKHIRQFMPSLRFFTVILISSLLGGWFIFQGIEPNKYDMEQWLALSKHVLFAYIPCAGTVVLAVLAWTKRIEHSYEVIIAAIASFIFISLAPFAPKTPFLAEVMLLIIVLWIIRMGMRINDRGITFLGFLSFSGYMLALYGITVGTLIDTAGFYAIAGLILFCMGAIVPKFLKSKGDVS